LPAFAESHGFYPWMNARRVSAEALAKVDVLRRVSPKMFILRSSSTTENGGVPRAMPVGLHYFEQPVLGRRVVWYQYGGETHNKHQWNERCCWGESHVYSCHGVR